MPIHQDKESGKWKIGDTGTPRYNSELTAKNAYENYLKRGGAPVPPVKK